VYECELRLELRLKIDLSALSGLRLAALERSPGMIGGLKSARPGTKVR
jgi:hypothetical protein